MEKFKNNPIWQVIMCVEKGGNIPGRESRYKAANRELDIVKGRINIQSEKAMKNLETFLSAFQNGQDKAANTQLKSAKDAFKSHLVPHYKREEEEEEKKKGLTKRDNSQQSECIPNSRERKDVEDVAKEFRNIYDRDLWLDAHEELDKHTRRFSDKEIAALLLEIVERAFDFCKKEAERQILEAKRVTEYIVVKGKVPDSSQTESNQVSPPNHLLRQYRYLNAHLSESRLIKEFLDGHVQTFRKKYELKQYSAIVKYAIVCIKITWLLSTEDPPVHMVKGKEGDDFDEHLYTNVTRKGKKIDYVAWPALNLYENGPVLSQGAAQCNK